MQDGTVRSAYWPARVSGAPRNQFHPASHPPSPPQSVQAIKARLDPLGLFDKPYTVQVGTLELTTLCFCRLPGSFLNQCWQYRWHPVVAPSFPQAMPLDASLPGPAAALCTFHSTACLPRSALHACPAGHACSGPTQVSCPDAASCAHSHSEQLVGVQQTWSGPLSQWLIQWRWPA